MSTTERKETTVLEVAPEKKQPTIRRQEEFGWTLVSAQEGVALAGGESRKQVKLLFTRTASAEWIEDMNMLEKELADHDNSVRFGADGLVLLGNKPSPNLPIPILVVVAFAGYLAGWLFFDVAGGILSGAGSVLFSWFGFRHLGLKKVQQHTNAQRKATEAFRKKRNEILVRIRAHENTRISP